jgi:hypothetical protein
VAHRRRPHRAGAAVLTLAAALAGAGCGGSEAQAPPDRALTVEEALRVDAEGLISVRGTLFADVESVRLCGAILESDPPQCGRPWLRVRGLDVVGNSNMEQAKGTTWSLREVVLVGTVEGRTLRVGPIG